MGERRKMPIRKELATIADLETGARVVGRQIKLDL